MFDLPALPKDKPKTEKEIQEESERKRREEKKKQCLAGK